MHHCQGAQDALRCHEGSPVIWSHEVGIPISHFMRKIVLLRTFFLLGIIFCIYQNRLPSLLCVSYVFFSTRHIGPKPIPIPTILLHCSFLFVPPIIWPLSNLLVSSCILVLFLLILVPSSCILALFLLILVPPVFWPCCYIFWFLLYFGLILTYFDTYCLWPYIIPTYFNSSSIMAPSLAYFGPIRTVFWPRSYHFGLLVPVIFFRNL